MKKLLTILLLCFLASVSHAEGNKYVQAVQKSLAKGDVKSMSKNFDNMIDITFSENKAVSYSKAQAGAILKKFFAKSITKGFKLRHQGKSNTNNTVYAIGTLYTNTANYRVYMFFVPSKGEFMLKELRFERL